MKKTTIDIEKAAHTVEQISKNRLILAILLVVDGILFLINPGQPVEGMGRAVATSIMIAAGALIISKIAAKERFVSFLPALILLAAGGLMYFFPHVFSAYFRIIIALLITINGVVNLSGVLGLGRVRGFLVTFNSKASDLSSKVKTPEELNNGIDGQAEKYMRPLHKIVSESQGNKAIFFATNLLSVILGVLLLVKPDLSITIFGVIFIFVGVNDFLLAFRTRKISEKLRDKKYREILLEETDEHENKTERNTEGEDQQT